MSSGNWRGNFLRNTITNYLSISIRIGTGLLLFRMLFQHLSHEQFGYYALLWSLFGYAILLDFGLGVAVQKTVARTAATGETEMLNRLVSTILWAFAGIAALLLGVFALGHGWFLDGIKVHAENRQEFTTAYFVFFFMLAVNFPLGLFPEVLRGLQRLDVANWAMITGNLVNVALMAAALLAHWSFPTIVFISTATTILPNLIAAICAYRYLPHLSLHPRNFCFREVRGVLSFSLVAYLITFTTLIMQRTDQGVISVTIGVSFVALYQVGFKAAEIFGLFSKQLQEALSPAAAHLGAMNDQRGLRELMFGSWRLTLLVTTPVYALCAAYLEPVIRILSGMKSVDASTFWVGQVLLLATYSSLASDSCSRRILVMCGWEKKLLRLTLMEGAINLVLSFTLVRPLGLLGVAVGTLVPTVLIGWFGVMPLTARFVGISGRELFREILTPVLAPVSAALIALGGLLLLAPLPAAARFWDCGWRGALVCAAALAFGAPYLRGIARRQPAAAAAH